MTTLTVCVVKMVDRFKDGSITYETDNGLVVAPPDKWFELKVRSGGSRRPEDSEDKLNRRLKDQVLVEPAGLVRSNDIHHWANEEGVSRATASRWIRRKVEQAVLKRKSRGFYEVVGKFGV